MTFQELVEQIKKFEGFRASAYDDLQPNVIIKDYSQLRGTLTIGYGRTTDVSIGEITNMEIESKWLESEVERRYKRVKNVTAHLDLNEDQRLALTDFTFNLGYANLLKLLNYGARSKKEVAESILLYNKAAGRVLPGLVKRRQFEYDLFVSGEIREEIQRNETAIKQLQSYCNVMIEDYDLPIDFIKVDGIWGPKSNACIIDIIDAIK